ncbi:MAG: helix-turn-helix domain-containing protein [Propionibacteriaceae bacterium]|nr:helix-turn-helix domain-containing protein [Propionibacteriaceae bacterium]
MTVVRERMKRSGLGPTRAEVLAELRSSGASLPVTTIAAAVGLHPNSARFHLDALVDQGLVERADEQRDRPGRPKALYRAAPHQLSQADALQGVARALVRHLGQLDGGRGEQAEAAGRMWGEELASAAPTVAPVERVMATLDALGYRPRPGESEGVIVLTPCPLRSLLDEAGPGGLPSICRLHLGLMRGLVSDDPDCVVTDLEALVTPDSCVARIQRRAADPA